MGLYFSPFFFPPFPSPPPPPIHKTHLGDTSEHILNVCANRADEGLLLLVSEPHVHCYFMALGPQCDVHEGVGEVTAKGAAGAYYYDLSAIHVHVN
jgi:hypothetical protein